MASLDYRNTNSLWGSVLAETLYRLGLQRAVISPGSRSTALTMALVRHQGIETIPVLDERSAAFFALGLAKKSGRPVLLVCTSGTAGANYLPAVIEARESGIPLIVITADRPPEMRECRSGQTIDQQKLFGNHVNFYHELAVPEATLERLSYLRQTVVQVWERAQWPDAGPVHLNAPFRDPLPPIEDGIAVRLKKGLREAEFFSAVVPAPRVATQIELAGFPTAKRGVIVVGAGQDASTLAEISAISRLARELNWPVLADGLSGLRGAGDQFPNLVVHYDAIVRGEKAGQRLKPEIVLCIGGWPTSKPLRAWLQKNQPSTWMISQRVQNLDALHLPTKHLRCRVAAFTASLISTGTSPADYLDRWQRAEAAATRRLNQVMAKASNFEGSATVVLAQNLPSATPVFVANSMPVRDVEYFWPVTDRAHQIYFNRGANGIDGTLSAALGVAHGGQASVLLTGDLALLHDTNGFLSLPKFKGSLTIVLINNDGGGIFGHLPVAQFNPPFEEFFATPQKVDFARLASAYGVTHVLVQDWTHLAELVKTLPTQGIRVLEVHTDRTKDAAFRKRIFAQTAAAVEKAIAG